MATNFGIPNYYNTATIATGRLPTPPEIGDLPTPTPEATRQKVVITGRGQGAGRVSTLVRLRPDVVAEIRSLVDGPLYLTIELALRRYAQELQARAPGSVEMIKASDLG